MRLRKVLVVALLLCMGSACLSSSGNVVYAQGMPTPDQLSELLAPVALYPDALLAQVCAASTDPQQILDVDQWMQQNGQMQGQALTDAAQRSGFDPAFIALVSFPQVLNMMAQNVDDYAAIGEAFAANQQSVMDVVQNLRQQAYANGALDSNQYQNVQVQTQDGSQVVVIQPANGQMVYVPQYDPYAVYATDEDMVTSSLLSFGAGIALGAWINNSQPWGWGGWGWNWGGRRMLVSNRAWVRGGRYRSPRPSYRPRPPRYTRPIHARPPNNWNQRPNRPGGNRPGTGNRPGNGNRPGTGNGPGVGRPGVGGGNGNVRPPGQGGNRPGPGGSGGTRPPGGGGNVRPPGGGNTRPPTTRPTTRPATPGGTPNTRPAPQARPATQPARNPYAGFPGANKQAPASRPQPQTGARPTALGGGNPGANRAASNRGQASFGGGGSRPAPAARAPQPAQGGRRR
jgi:hypothetical protein